MSVGSKIWRGTIYVSAANILARVGTFLGNLAVIQLLGKDMLGELGLIESWLSLVTMFSLFGLGTAATKYISHYLETDKERIGSITGAALLAGSAFSLATGLILYISLNSSSWESLGSNSFEILIITRDVLANHAVILFWLVIVLTYDNILTGVIYGLQAFEVLINVNFVIGIISFPILYFLVRLNGVAGALDARLILTLMETILLSYAVHTKLQTMGAKISLSDISKDSRQLLAFGLPTFIGQLAANPVQPFIMSLLAAQSGGLGQVGLLTTAKRMSNLPNFLPGSVSSTLMPILSTEWGQGQLTSFRESILLAIRMLWLNSIPIVLFFLAASPTLLGWLYGPEFTEAWAIAFVLLVTVLLVSINQTADHALAAAGQMWLSTANNFVWTVMFILASVWLIPQYLALGYVLAFLITFSIYVCLQLWWLKRLFKTPLKPLFPLLFLSATFVLLAWFIASRANSFGQFIFATLLAGLSLIIEWHLFLSSQEKQALLQRGTTFWLTGITFPGRVLKALKRS